VTLREIARRLELETLTPELGDGGDIEMERGYVSDLLSDVLANGPRGGVLVTAQLHLNVVAVAVHAEMRAVIFAQGRTPEENVRRKAAAEGIQLYGCAKSAFEIVGRLHSLGVRGPDA
jgi:hypothetical protein